jgi:hypothetical protein
MARAVPNPWRLWRQVRTTQFPMRQPSYLVSRGAGRLHPVHIHQAFVDVHGKGTTSIDVSHFHRILNWRILPDESDSHEHGLTRILTGRGI